MQPNSPRAHSSFFPPASVSKLVTIRTPRSPPNPGGRATSSHLTFPPRFSPIFTTKRHPTASPAPGASAPTLAVLLSLICTNFY
jgi:hypothetical protein